VSVTVAEKECDALMMANHPESSGVLAEQIAAEINRHGRSSRADKIVALVIVLLTACEPEDVLVQSEAAIELLRRYVRMGIGRAGVGVT
jgi:hypothetical protein